MITKKFFLTTIMVRYDNQISINETQFDFYISFIFEKISEFLKFPIPK